MNPLQIAGRYLQGQGSNRAIQTAADYALGGVLGAGGQQLMNWITPGADPNPLLSGALYAPLGVATLRSGRGILNLAGNSKAANRDFGLLSKQISNPYEQAALAGSLAGVTGGGLTSAYNTLTNGTDYDNNLIAAGVGSLAAIAPIAMSLVNSRRSRNPSEANIVM